MIVGSFISAFAVASLCEESFKYYLANGITINNYQHSSSQLLSNHGNSTDNLGNAESNYSSIIAENPFSVVIYTVAGAVGMASLENLMYIMGIVLKGDIGLALSSTITRAFLTIPLHATTGKITEYLSIYIMIPNEYTINISLSIYLNYLSIW